FGFAVLGLAVAQFAENRHYAANLAERWRLGGQFQRAPQRIHSPPDDLDFLVDGFGHGQYHGVEPAFERGRQLVNAAVAVGGRRDHVEAFGGLDFFVEFGNRQSLFREDGYQRVLHIRGNARQFLDAGDLAVLHRAHQRTRREGLARWAFGEQAGVIPAVADGL